MSREQMRIRARKQLESQHKGNVKTRKPKKKKKIRSKGGKSCH